MNKTSNLVLMALALGCLLNYCHGSILDSLLFTPACPLYTPGSVYDRACSCDTRSEEMRGSKISCRLNDDIDLFYLIMKNIAIRTNLIDSIDISCSLFGRFGVVASKLPKLRVYHLRLSNCGITSMDMAALEESAFWLENLELPFNGLTEIKNLHLLYHLKTLDLKGNKFTNISDATFAYNPDLETVDLSYNYDLKGTSSMFGATRKIKKAFPGKPDILVKI